MLRALVVLAGALVFQGQPLFAHPAGASTSFPTAAASNVSRVGPTQDDDSGPLVDAGTLSRWMMYLALMLSVGASAFGVMAGRVFRGQGSRGDVAQACQRQGLRWGLTGSLLFLLAGTGRLWAQALAFLFPGDPLTLADVSTVLFETDWGTRWIIQFGAGVAATLGFAFARRGLRAGFPVAVIGAIAMAVTLPLTGHALAGSWHWSITWPLQALHVLAGATWLGSLLVLVLVAVGATSGVDAATRERTVADLVAVFSPVALAGVGGAVVMGIVLSVSYVGSWPALWQTTYGRMLLVKVALLGVTALLGAYNWRLLRPRLGTVGSARRLFQSARLELLVGALLLAATAILVALPAPHV